MIVKDKKGYLLLENNGVSGLEPRALIIKFEFLICNRVSLPDKCKALTPRTPRPPIEFVISIKLITPIAKLNRETMSVLTSIGILNNIAKNTKIIIFNYYTIYSVVFDISKEILIEKFFCGLLVTEEV